MGGIMKYDLDNLGDANFEHMVQALLLRKFGIRGRVYGQGKDGGRELTYEGAVEIDPLKGDNKAWNGHILVQAKFCNDRLGTSKDQTWFLRQLKAEMDAWLNPKSERRRKNVKIPNYFLFATNVMLSPASGGGLDQFDALMKGYSETLSIRGWHVLHREEIERMLDGEMDVRRRFSALIAPGDALHSATDVVGTSVDFRVALQTHAKKLLRDERIIRLSEQGVSTADKLYLEQVGIDLSSTVPTDGANRKTVSTLKHILAHGDAILTPSGGTSRMGPPHVLLVGGPGQGKTTLSQMLGQFYRVALFDEAQESTMPRAVADVLDATRGTMEALGIDVPKNRRWPLRIDLAEYGDAISGGEELSILRWITRLLAKRSDSTISHAATTAWLKNWPWLLVLDGLDEVAHPDVREAVRSAVEDLLVEAGDLDADLLVVLTTRPQGFESLFSQEEFLEMRLAELDQVDALHYADKVAAFRNHDDDQLREASLSRLAAAFDQPTTARLMSTPLQVTIMLLLFESETRVPSNRYDLFSKYYMTVLSREAGKPGHVAALIDAHRGDVLHVHQVVGLRLQFQSESSSNAESILSRSEFSTIIENRLLSEGYDLAKTEALTERLTTAALDRLVLLVPRGEGLGFEVRSLQEFMAASSITSGADTEVLDKLRTIAISTHWRNTFLLAIGRIFTDREHLRGSAVAVLREIDATDAGDGALSVGPDLALACIDEGVADRAPMFGRLLLQHALESLRFPPRLGQLHSTARVLAAMSTDRSNRDQIVDALKAADDGSIQTRASALVAMTYVQQLKLLGNPLWIFVRDALPLWKRRLIQEEADLVEAWCQSGGVASYWSDATPVEQTDDREVGVGDLLFPDVNEFRAAGGLGRIPAVVTDLNQTTVRLLYPDFAFAMPPTEPPRSAVLAEVLAEPAGINAWSRAVRQLRSGQWPVAAHAYGLAREVRMRRGVGEIFESRSPS
jgi:hypothetical protein